MRITDMQNDPRWMQLTASAQLLYLFIETAQWRNESMTWSYTGITKVLHLSRRTVITAMRDLEQAGFIRRWQDGGKTHTQVVQQLHQQEVKVVQPLHGGGAIPAPEVVQPLHSGGATIAPKVLSKSKGKSKYKYTPEFEEFWSVYPRKAKKADALSAFNDALERADLPTIIAGIDSINTSNPQYIPYPATWLRADGWLDERPKSFHEHLQEYIDAEFGVPEEDEALGNGAERPVLTVHTSPTGTDRNRQSENHPANSRDSEPSHTYATSSILQRTVRGARAMGERKP